MVSVLVAFKPALDALGADTAIGAETEEITRTTAAPTVRGDSSRPG